MERLVEQINELKKELNAVILVHAYQRPEIQEIGDFVGDSLGLCIQAAQTDADVIVFCGVHFMAESAKLLNPGKTVLLPELGAGCPMADMADGKKLRELKEKHPNAEVVCYVNSTAEVKAESDICCTSSNAIDVINSIPKDREIIFVPDKHLGRYAGEKAGRDIILWPGFCPTHQRLLVENIQELRKKYSDGVVCVHPECSKEVVEEADFVGSTTAIYEYCCNSDEKTFIIGTEEGILHRLKKDNPDKEFVLASDLMVCKNMKKIDLSSVVKVMEKMENQIEVDPELAVKALLPIQKMLDLG
jgi:quinolinate synthase